MKPAEAIRIATTRVRYHSFGSKRGLGQYRVDWFDDTRNAWWDGAIISDRRAALQAAWSCKVAIALELLGVDEPNYRADRACYEDYPRDWRRVVVEQAKAAKLLQDNDPLLGRKHA